MIKIFFKLLFGGAGIKQWQLEIGAHLLRKGCGYQIGQIVGEKKLDNSKKKIYRVQVVTELFFDFRTNKVNHRLEKRIMNADEIKR